MTTTTKTGSGSVKALLINYGTATLPANVDTSILQSGPVTITGSGTTATFYMHVQAQPGAPSSVMLTLMLDGSALFTGWAGSQPYTFSSTLSAGSHTVDFIAHSYQYTATLASTDLTITDQGL